MRKTSLVSSSRRPTVSTWGWTACRSEWTCWQWRSHNWTPLWRKVDNKHCCCQISVVTVAKTTSRHPHWCFWMIPSIHPTLFTWPHHCTDPISCSILPSFMNNIPRYLNSFLGATTCPQLEGNNPPLSCQYHGLSLGGANSNPKYFYLSSKPPQYSIATHIRPSCTALCWLF